MKASYLGAMGYARRRDFPRAWPTPPACNDPDLSAQSYQDGIAECQLAEAAGFEWISFSEHHYSGRIATGAPAVMAAAVAERCRQVKIALLGPLLPLNNPVRLAEELALLDNLTGGRLVMGFLRGTPNEDQVYGVNPAEGRERMLEGMDLILKAMTEPQPFAWEGRYYQFRTVAVWPRPVQRPFPPALVATRSAATAHYAATHRLGLGVSFLPVAQTGDITDRYYRWCAEAGWTPQPDQVVFRGSIYLAETDGQAQEWFDRQVDQGRARAWRCGHPWRKSYRPRGPAKPRTTATSLPAAPAATSWAAPPASLSWAAPPASLSWAARIPSLNKSRRIATAAALASLTSFSSSPASRTGTLWRKLTCSGGKCCPASKSCDRKPVTGNL